ncbi:TRAP transporter small permease [Sediminimonas qiaohouensis]|nr:TRAP transporter small permease subunit [Sediminimonas qiaohouensis]
MYDLTEMGMAAAVFAFLPWCQYKQGHATVELASALFPRTFDMFLSLLFNSAMTVVAVVGTWRLYLGMQDKLTYGETTLIAQIPVWYGFAASLVGGCGFIIVSAFCVLRYARAMMRRNTLETGHV